MGVADTLPTLQCGVRTVLAELSLLRQMEQERAHNHAHPHCPPPKRWQEFLALINEPIGEGGMEALLQQLAGQMGGEGGAWDGQGAADAAAARTAVLAWGLQERLGRRSPPCRVRQQLQEACSMRLALLLWSGAEEPMGGVEIELTQEEMDAIARCVAQRRTAQLLCCQQCQRSLARSAGQAALPMVRWYDVAPPPSPL